MRHFFIAGFVAVIGLVSGCSALQTETSEGKAELTDKNSPIQYQIGVESGWNKILKDFPFQGKIVDRADIYLCRGEYEPIQLVILYPDGDLKGVQVTVTDLIGNKGVLSKEHVDINVVGYVRTKRPLYEVNYVGLHPDPLEQREFFDVGKNDIQPLWVTVHAPEGVVAGNYEGVILIKPANAPASQVKLNVYVWDFNMPKTPSLPLSFFLWDGHLNSFYNLNGLKDKQKSRDIFRRYLYFLIERKISPIWIPEIFVDVNEDKSYDFTWVDETLEESFKRGAVNFNLSGSGGSMSPDNPFLKAFYNHVKDKGWMGKSYLYGKDEASSQEIDGVVKYYTELKGLYPDIKILQTMWLPYNKSPGIKLQGLVDIWVPLTSQLDINVANECRDRGEHVWWYVCCVPDRPWANLFIDGMALEPRVLFWNNFKFNVQGFLYWGVNVWTPNQDGADEAVKYPNKEWDTWSYFREDNEGRVMGGYNGDGQLIYPGPYGVPWSSIRMECLRDGIEDFEYFKILDDRLSRLKEFPGQDEDIRMEGERLMTLAMDLAGNPLVYSRDHLQLSHMRFLIGSYLDKTAH